MTEFWAMVGVIVATLIAAAVADNFRCAEGVDDRGTRRRRLHRQPRSRKRGHGSPGNGQAKQLVGAGAGCASAHESGAAPWPIRAPVVFGDPFSGPLKTRRRRFRGV